MSLKRASQTSIFGVLAMGFLCSTPMIAQANSTDSAPIKQPSAFEAIDQVSGTQSIWSELSISPFATDAKDLFVIERDEARIQRRSKDIDTLYQEILKQQTEGHAIIRTQDLNSPFETSLMEMQK